MGKKVKPKKESVEMLTEICGRDYVGAAVSGILKGWESVIQERTKNIDQLEEIDKEYTKCYENLRKGYESYNFDISPDDFMYMEGDKKTVHNTQLPMVMYASVCYSGYSGLKMVSEMLSEKVNDIFGEDSNYKKSVIWIESGQYSKSHVEAIDNYDKKALFAGKDFGQILTDGGISAELSYESMQEKCKKLNSAGIKAKVYNHVISGVASNRCKDERERYKNRCDSLRERVLDADRLTHFVRDRSAKNTSRWLIAITLLLGIFLTLFYTKSIGITLLCIGGLLWAVRIICFIALPIHKRRLNRKMDTLTELITSTVTEQCNYEKMMDAAQSEVVDKVYDLFDKVENYARLVKKGIEERNAENEKAYIQATKFLPADLDRSLLPKAAELMNEGKASDFETALWRAEQSRQMQDTYMDYRELVLTFQRNQEEFNKLQAQISNKYRQQQLEAERERVESQKRTEEYTRQQAELAEKQVRAAESAAKAAENQLKATEKQLENSEELIRRSTDPYYINLWKNGNK